MTTMQSLSAPGWFGKLPTLGDFASRRLAPQWIETWDAWLARGLAGWREQDPEHWSADYLEGPSLRFMVMPGVMAAQSRVPSHLQSHEPDPGWVGVLMPSVDRVGRYFPLTLAHALSHLPANPDELARLLAWLAQLDDLAVAALHDDWTPDQLEAELHALGSLPVRDAATPSASSASASTGIHGDATALVWALARAPLLQSLHGKVLWWCDSAPGQLLLRVTSGLPQAHDFSALLSTPTATTPPLSPPLTPPSFHL